MESGKPSASAVERELAHARDRLGSLLAELNRRRHELVNVRGHLERHKQALAIAAGGVVMVVASVVALGVQRRRRRRRPSARLRQLRAAFDRLVAHPERVGKTRPTLGTKVAGAVLTTAIGVIGRRLAQRPRRTPQATS